MKLTVAVAQTATVLFDTPATLARAEALMQQAAARGARVLVFPEAFIGGYPKGADFHIFIGARTPEGRQDFKKYYDAAGTLDGSTLRAVDTPYGKLGAVICWENYMPALRMAMYKQRVALYCAPTADDRDTWISTLQHIAMEGRCFVLSSCQHLRRAQFPMDAMHNRLPEAPDTVLMRGGSCIIGPLGQVLAGPVYGEDVLLTAEIDLDDIARAQMDFDPVGHYARPDVFQLAVNTAPQHAVLAAPGATAQI